MRLALYPTLLGADRATLRSFAKGPVYSSKIYRLNYRLREQVRSHCRFLPSLPLRFQPRF
ncbi:hypothetical protein D5S10_00785 [Pseudomonas savastanoi]|nr:hypothetical protein PSYTB_00380 [Pseudomonas amygdali pv. tabaci str. ATCC 11528]QOI02553.1 hypothetical protein D5S10_00785 [Pseudomonas savastanoi]